ncbi:unnamed protein product (macronuclear) [Paramecium tetraurelia]|uniref:Thioredoxin domain-containing protein n=1 Tax=Paramecium tetraurelia TaxID=5888 RepID=A0CHN4_PARTE|nr:uncharacterized protein GSPATT00038403001 [Paramecium tetraurelia]CAK70301.1 unnamed protein product [Paramecium tetraurelia]|eukprot:XP_001437698.1 hypothetical protein (macronuclear) [Paramecium tetraurelia strain d4-2]
MQFIFLLLLFLASASINELNSKNFEQFIDQYPYALIHFYRGYDCEKCNEVDLVIEKVQINFKEKLLGFGKINCTKNPLFIKRFGINKYPALIFFRQGDVEVYEGQKSYTALFQWLKENLRPLVHIIEDTHSLQEFLTEKVALVYFASENEFIDPFILMKMKEVNMKYSLFYMVLAKSPTIRREFDIEDGTNLVIFPQNGEHKKYKGYIQDMENYLIQEALPLIYTGTDLEIQHIMKNQMPFLLIFDEMNQEYFEIAERNQYFVKLFIFDIKDTEAIEIFSQLLQLQIDTNYIYFHETKNKKTQKITKKDVQVVIWDYIDREDGIRFDI